MEISLELIPWLTISFGAGALVAGVVVHLIHVKVVNQRSHGNKSPNTSGDGNKVQIQ